ncbi:MAG: peptidoglycan-binding domain-containing protein [Candidatus Omnitrophota bacterium]|nr:peptidoglycan-binding domain-containing protein [Candidatus Omnitrophota bacterium]
MGKALAALACSTVFLFALSGCASTSANKQADLEMQGLKNQITLLEAQVQSKDAEISSLKVGSVPAQPQDEASASLSTAGSVAAAPQSSNVQYAALPKKPGLKQIQTALKRAGYDPGSMDGKMGKQTRQAIKAFQKANNLSADGRVGKKTWQALAPYLPIDVK